MPFLGKIYRKIGMYFSIRFLVEKGFPKGDAIFEQYMGHNGAF
jgi:hypothetical protein